MQAFKINENKLIEEASAMPKLYILASGLMMACAAMSVRAQNPFESIKSFSATFVISGMSSKASEGRGEAKIYRSGTKIRTTLPGGAGYTLIDVTEHTTYMVMGGGMCMQMTVQGQENPFAQAPDTTVERSSAGTDTVDGHACKVENLTVTPHAGPRAGQPTKMKVWEAEDLHGFPIKVETQTSRGPMTIEYKDVSLAEPDASLFTHPQNCRQMPGMPAGSPH
jgi:outer membrane lipoprotein-sorting protein